MHSSAQSTINYLKKKLAKCRQDLLSLLEEGHYINNELQPRLLFQYENHFGPLELRIYKNNRRAAELDNRLKLLKQKIFRGEEIDESSILNITLHARSELDKKENKCGKESDASAYNNGNGNNGQTSGVDGNGVNNYTMTITSEMPKLYRNIVKKLHPDIAGETEDFKKFWNDIQQAYNTQNLNRMRLFHQTLCPEENNELDNTIDEETYLRKEITKLENNICKELQKLTDLKSREPFTIQSNLEDAEWIENRRIRLNNKIKILHKEILFKENRLKALVSKNASNGNRYRLMKRAVETLSN